MVDSYIGVVSRRGLEELWPEEGCAARRLARRLGHAPAGRELGCWAQLAPQHARVIQQTIRRGGRRAALRLLNEQARSLGALAP